MTKTSRIEEETVKVTDSDEETQREKEREIDRWIGVAEPQKRKVVGWGAAEFSTFICTSVTFQIHARIFCLCGQEVFSYWLAILFVYCWYKIYMLFFVYIIWMLLYIVDILSIWYLYMFYMFKTINTQFWIFLCCWFIVGVLFICCFQHTNDI